jgi:hypothetical protein
MNTTRTIAWGKWMMAAVLLALVVSGTGCQATGAQANMNATFAQSASQRAQSASAKAATYTCAAAASYRDAAAQAAQSASASATAAATQRDQANRSEALVGQLNAVLPELEAAQTAFDAAARNYRDKLQTIEQFTGPSTQNINDEVVWASKNRYFEQFQEVERAAQAMHDAHGRVGEAFNQLAAVDVEGLRQAGLSNFADELGPLAQSIKSDFDRDTEQLAKVKEAMAEAQDWLDRFDVLSFHEDAYSKRLNRAGQALNSFTTFTPHIGVDARDGIDVALETLHTQVETATLATKESADAAANFATEANRNAILAAKACGQLPPQFEEYVVENPFNDLNNPYPDWNSTFWDFSSP